MLKEKRVKVSVALTADLYLSLKHFAKLSNQSVTALMGQLLARALEPQEADSDQLTLMVRNAVKDALIPTENVLAKLAANAAMAAAAGMYLGVQCAADLGTKDVVEMHKRAEIYARENWRKEVHLA